MTKSINYSNFHSIIKTLCLMLSFASCQIVLADATLTYQTSNGNYNLQLKNKQLFIKNIDTNTDLLYDQNRDHAILIQHQKRNYLVFNQTEIANLNQQISGLQSAITSNLSSDQRAQLNEFLGGALGPDTSKGTDKQKNATSYSIKSVGEAKVGDFVCQQHQVLENGKASGSLCTASSQQLQLNPLDYATLMSFQRFAINASNTLGDSIRSVANIQVPDLNKSSIREFLIFSKIENQTDTDLYLQSVNQNSINNNFVVPKNYQRGTVSAASLIR